MSRPWFLVLEKETLKGSKVTHMLSCAFHFMKICFFFFLVHFIYTEMDRVAEQQAEGLLKFGYRYLWISLLELTFTCTTALAAAAATMHTEAPVA